MLPSRATPAPNRVATRPLSRRGNQRPGILRGEVLCLLGLAFLIAVSWGPALKHLSSSRALTVSAEKITRLLEAARENAVARQMPTALIVLTRPGSEEKFRTFTIAERGQNGTWHQIRYWESLAAGVTLEADPRHCAFLQNSSPLPGYTGDQIAFGDRLLTGEDFAYLIFQPDGALTASKKTAQIRLVAGRIPGDRPTAPVEHSNGDRNGSANFYDIAVTGAPGLLLSH